MLVAFDRVIKGNYMVALGNEALFEKEKTGSFSKTGRTAPLLLE